MVANVPGAFRRASKSRLLPLVILATLACALVGCASQQLDENDPASLYRDAEEDIKSDHYQIAIDKFRMIRNKFPYSKYSIDAQLRIADIYFMQESFAEAAASYESFYDLHPKHEKVPYAMFRAAKSFYKDIPSPISRDLASAQKALEAYTEFLRRFPNAAEANEARADANAARKALAEKELYIAEFYFKRGQLDSARPRFLKVIELYPETDAAKQAKEKLGRIERKAQAGAQP
ncbi:MAG: outer membrane protein assembly factor BamD [Oligoflexia bacterium]|nr:outer membrane protein assembly factor BamD [Oligoflexia bacterium]